MPCPHQVTLCRRDPSNYGEKISMDYLLGPADAIVVHMCSPPPSAYFSMDAYLSSRYTAGADPFYPGTNFGKLGMAPCSQLHVRPQPMLARD